MKLKENGKKGQVVDVTCSECKRSTKHEVLTDIIVEENEEAAPGVVAFWWRNEYQIIRCRGCETFSFRRICEHSEHRDQRGERVTDVDLYPKPEKAKSILRVRDYRVLSTKPNLLRIYIETLGALNEDLPVLAGMGIRAIVETVCRDKKAAGRNLRERIDDLVTQGVLTQEGADILHKLRTLGNQAAHEVTPHDNVQLSLALDVIHHLLQGVYILPHHSQRGFK